MRIPGIYLETTIFNFPFADDAPQYRADTLRLLRRFGRGSLMPIPRSMLSGNREIRMIR